MNCFALTALLTASGSLFAADLGQYQVILEKQILGRKAPESAPVVTSPTQTNPEPTWSRQYRMTLMTLDEDEGTVRVGLQNIQDKSSVLLIQGTPRSVFKNFSLISADFEMGTAEISYMGSTHSFDLQTQVTAPASVPATRPSPRAPTVAQGNNSRPTRSPQGTPPRNALRNRPGAPRSSESTPLQIRRFASQEELKAHLKEQQMDAIRTGKPPLPIPLTPEMDSQLVREGVLPPLQ